MMYSKIEKIYSWPFFDALNLNKMYLKNFYVLLIDLIFHIYQTMWDFIQSIQMLSGIRIFFLFFPPTFNKWKWIFVCFRFYDFAIAVDLSGILVLLFNFFWDFWILSGWSIKIIGCYLKSYIMIAVMILIELLGMDFWVIWVIKKFYMLRRKIAF